MGTKKRAFNPYKLPTAWIDGDEFIANPQDAHSLRELAGFHNRIASKLARYFAEGNEGYWYYLNYFVYANHQFITKPGFEFCLPLIRALEHVKDGDTVTVEADNAWGPTIAEMISILYDGKVRVIKKGLQKKRHDPLLDNMFILRTAMKTRILINYLIGLGRRSLGIGRKERKKRTDVVFLENVRFIDRRTKKSQLYAGIQSKLDEEGISYKTVTYAPLSEKVYLGRILREFLFDKRPFIGDYFRFRTFRENKALVKKLRKLWREADADPAFRKLFRYKGKDFYKLIRPRFDLLMSALAYTPAENRNLTKAILAQEHHKVQVIDHEENQYAKGLMLNSKLDPRVKTVALSHELPGPGSNNTRPTDKESDDRTSVAWRPLPNCKCVWSAFMKQIFIKENHYPKDIFAVTGNPRLDTVLRQRPDREELCRKYSLDPEKRYILITTTLECTRMETYCRMARHNKGYVWIIKHHPSRSMKPLMKEYSAANPPKNLIVRSNAANINELITVSDAVMVMTSSVGPESAVLGKPLLYLNLDKWDFSAFHTVPTTAGIEITRIEQLPAALAELEDPKKRAAIMQRIKRYAEKFNHRRDGKASERIAKEIACLLDTKRRLRRYP